MLLLPIMQLSTRPLQPVFADLAASELNKALAKVAKWKADAVPAEQKTFIRINAFVLEV